jgi:uncharacterized Tic20 family protein
VLVIIFGIGLCRRLPAKTTTWIGLGLLLVGGLGLIGAGYFHCNEACKNVFAEPDLTGRLHLLFSFQSGMGTALAPFFIWASMRHSEKWAGYAVPTLITAILANLPGITLWLTIATGTRLALVEGLIQRLGFIIVLIWIFVVATKLWRLASRRE